MRGDPENSWLTFLELQTSRERARMPKLSNATWREIATPLFPAGANAVLMTDSASAYRDVQLPGVVDFHSVNHSENEFARSVDVLSNVGVSRSTEPGTAGTFIIDRAWRSYKQCVPPAMSPKTEAGRCRISMDACE